MSAFGGPGLGIVSLSRGGSEIPIRVQVFDSRSRTLPRYKSTTSCHFRMLGRLAPRIWHPIGDWSSPTIPSTSSPSTARQTTPRAMLTRQRGCRTEPSDVTSSRARSRSRCDMDSGRHRRSTRPCAESFSNAQLPHNDAGRDTVWTWRASSAGAQRLGIARPTITRSGLAIGADGHRTASSCRRPG